MDKTFEKYFLGANSAEGFISFFGQCYNALDGWRAFIIKGGPGTGKSSFMKYVTAKAVDMGYKVTLCPCSSDPDSLDGIIIADIKTVLLDGTSPHVVEPKFAGACEQIINLGDFWNTDALGKTHSEIIDVTLQNKKLHKRAAAYIKAAGELINDNLKISRAYTNSAKAEKFAQKICNLLLPSKKQKHSYEWVRFLGGVTPKGIISYHGNIERFYKKLVVIEDKYGGTSGIIMEHIRKTALDRGYEIITVKNRFLPSKLTDHILIPELSLAFVREWEYSKFSDKHRRIHARRFCDANKIRNAKSRTVFNRRVSKELLFGAIETLKKAKQTHDVLEGYYISAMNFEALTTFIEQKTNEVLKRNN